jgi:FlaA1/EpsC-like NDP-sugar epimerase
VVDCVTPSLLLGRPLLSVPPLPEGFFRGRTVLVTGAGGSIASALSRALVRLRVGSLILVDHAEGNLESVDRELRERSPDGRITAILGDVGEPRLVDRLFEEHRPDLVFHAAAFKHVPLLEGQPLAAVANNVLATQALAAAAGRWGCRRFVLLSTDKAVNPTSIMGATKRVAEILVVATHSGTTETTALRLGNVLGSSGSVVPRLRAQIRRRQPLTLSHPDATRYFAAPREAVALLLSAAHAEGGGVLLPDLGRPIRIVDLARRLLDAASVDLPLNFVGLQPGEKLHEERHAAAERPEPTGVPGLDRIGGCGPAKAVLDPWVEEVRKLVAERDVSALPACLRRLIPEYAPSSRVLEAARAACPR